MTKSTKFRAPKIANMAFLELLVSLKLFSLKIWMTEKLWNFHIVSGMHNVKKQEISLSELIFRQINCFAISLVKTLISRNFCLKGKRVNFHTHSVEIKQFSCHSDFTWNQFCLLLPVMNFEVLEIFDIFKSDIPKISKFKAFKMVKLAVFDLLKSSKIVFT